MSTVEWTEADKGAYVRFAADIREVRTWIAQMHFLRVVPDSREVDRRLGAALDRLGLL